MQDILVYVTLVYLMDKQLENNDEKHRTIMYRIWLLLYTYVMGSPPVILYAITGMIIYETMKY